MNDIRNGKTPGDIIASLQDALELDSMVRIQMMMDKLVIFYNNTKQWALKGYSPSEMSPMRKDISHKAEVISMITKLKIGRNDLCPCGSGKKFKKCCGV